MKTNHLPTIAQLRNSVAHGALLDDSLPSSNGHMIDLVDSVTGRKDWTDYGGLVAVGVAIGLLIAENEAKAKAEEPDEFEQAVADQPINELKAEIKELKARLPEVNQVELMLMRLETALNVAEQGIVNSLHGAKDALRGESVGSTVPQGEEMPWRGNLRESNERFRRNVAAAVSDAAVKKGQAASAKVAELEDRDEMCPRFEGCGSHTESCYRQRWLRCSFYVEAELREEPRKILVDNGGSMDVEPPLVEPTAGITDEEPPDLVHGCGNCVTNSHKHDEPSPCTPGATWCSGWEWRGVMDILRPEIGGVVCDSCGTLNHTGVPELFESDVVLVDDCEAWVSLVFNNDGSTSGTRWDACRISMKEAKAAFLAQDIKAVVFYNENGPVAKITRAGLGMEAT